MIELVLQNPNNYHTVPAHDDLQKWAAAAIQSERKDRHQAASLVIRVVDEAEGRALNKQYRHKDRPTNVLSFPFEAPELGEQIPELRDELAEQPDYLGDLVLCEPVVMSEAVQQAKLPRAHWAHLIVHGTLHLQGYDHLTDDEANEMESLEVEILQGLGFDNPYEKQ